MKIRKNDTAQMICGKDKGKKGKVIKVSPEKGRIVVEGLNLSTKHVRPKKQGEKGQRIKFPASVSASNAMIVCPKCSKPAKTGYKTLESKKKARICRKCGEII